MKTRSGRRTSGNGTTQQRCAGEKRILDEGAQAKALKKKAAVGKPARASSSGQENAQENDRSSPAVSESFPATEDKSKRTVLSVRRIEEGETAEESLVAAVWQDTDSTLGEDKEEEEEENSSEDEEIVAVVVAAGSSKQGTASAGGERCEKSDNESGDDDSTVAMDVPQTQTIGSAATSNTTGETSVEAASTVGELCVGEDGIVTEATKSMWRRCMIEIRDIQIPSAPEIRPVKTVNAFIAKVTVLLAYLIVHAEIGETFPKISKKLRIKDNEHRMDDLAAEITGSNFYYGQNSCWLNAHNHIAECRPIGTWVANTKSKLRYNGTWKVEEGHVVGDKNGLYELYRDFLVKIGLLPSGMIRISE